MNREAKAPGELTARCANLGRERLIQVLLQYEYWDDLIELCQSGYIEPARSPAGPGKIHAELAIAHYSRGSFSEGDKKLAKLRSWPTIKRLSGTVRSRRPAGVRKGNLRMPPVRPLPPRFAP